MALLGRGPHGLRGLKRQGRQVQDRGQRRGPHGLRGLKPICGVAAVVAGESRPARAAWIETRWTVPGRPEQRVAARTGCVD